MATRTAPFIRPSEKTAAISVNTVEPVRPYVQATPNRRMALANEPSRKYFSPPSLLNRSVLWKPARM